MAGPSSPFVRRALWMGAAGAAAFLVLAIFWSDLPIGGWIHLLWKVFTKKEAARRFVESAGALGPLVFIALQVTQVIISPIPGEATGIIGGFLFGTWLGFLYSSIGLTIGSVAAFCLGHLLGAPLIQRIGGPRWHRALDFVGHTGGELVSFVLFLLPGFPKDYLSYLLGFSPMPLRAFVLISMFGRMPGTWLLSAQGASLANDDRTFFWVLVVLMAVIVVLAFLFRDRLLQALRHASRQVPSGDTPRR